MHDIGEAFSGDEPGASYFMPEAIAAEETREAYLGM